jgi:hypothetical protein
MNRALDAIATLPAKAALESGHDRLINAHTIHTTDNDLCYMLSHGDAA